MSNYNKIEKTRISYNYCGLCGRTPHTNLDEPNYAPMRWWDPDDGWKITTLCRHCWQDVCDDMPKAEDYAYRNTNGTCDVENTDEDAIAAL